MTDLLEQKLTPSEEAVESKVGDETIILHLSNGTYYGLDSVGTFIWDLLKQATLPRVILDLILAEYNAEPAAAEADLRRFLTDLLEQTLLVNAD
ncbi:MAG: PqqD family protein [Rhodobacteraceae bacterium]|nr:PqqD family protein [Paracoccaceae bacterium]